MKSNLIGISRASIEAEEAKHKGKASPPAAEPVFTLEDLQAVTEHASEGSLHIPDRSTIIGASVTPLRPAVTTLSSMMRLTTASCWPSKQPPSQALPLARVVFTVSAGIVSFIRTARVQDKEGKRKTPCRNAI